MSAPIQLLFVGAAPPDLATSALGPFIVQSCSGLDEAAQHMQQNRFDALLLRAPDGVVLQQWPALSHAVLDMALVVLLPEPGGGTVARLLQLGVQEVVPTREAQPERIALALRQSVERKRLELAARRAYATDLGTGLPNHAQLMEHMTHLLALREREPAPMAVLVLRIEGLAAAEATWAPKPPTCCGARSRCGCARACAPATWWPRSAPTASPCCWRGSMTLPTATAW